MDFAKRLLDYGFTRRTTYFPAASAGQCLLIEPTETESNGRLDAFVSASHRSRRRPEQEPARVPAHRHTMPCAASMMSGRRGNWISSWKPTVQS